MDNGQIHEFISLKKSGEVKVDPRVAQNLIGQLIKSVDTSCFSEAHRRIKRESKVRIHTHSCFYPEVFSVPKRVVIRWARSLGLVSVPGLYSDLDLDQGKYEGGFKVWESTNDLIQFITKDKRIMNEILHNGDEFTCLELGAGASLPTLALIGRLIKDPDFTANYQLHVQDYNWQVLASLTLLNFAINLPSDYFTSLLDSRSLRFFYGDWKDFKRNSTCKYNLIMMSEVIYNQDNYEGLHNLLNQHLSPDGYIVIATKNTYFGLSGGLYSWMDYINSKNIFRIYKTIPAATTNIPRSVLIMKRL